MFMMNISKSSIIQYHTLASVSIVWRAIFSGRVPEFLHTLVISGRWIAADFERGSILNDLPILHHQDAVAVDDRLDSFQERINLRYRNRTEEGGLPMRDGKYSASEFFTNGFLYEFVRSIVNVRSSFIETHNLNPCNQ